MEAMIWIQESRIGASMISCAIMGVVAVVTVSVFPEVGGFGSGYIVGGDENWALFRSCRWRA